MPSKCKHQRYIKLHSYCTCHDCELRLVDKYNTLMEEMNCLMIYLTLFAGYLVCTHSANMAAMTWCDTDPAWHQISL